MTDCNITYKYKIYYETMRFTTLYIIYLHILFDIRHTVIQATMMVTDEHAGDMLDTPEMVDIWDKDRVTRLWKWYLY